jgi:DNA polymerase III delta prime subunit
MKINPDFIKTLRKSVALQHTNFSYVVNTTLAHVQYGCNGRVLMIIGPTGVGKSTAMKFCAHKLSEYVRDNPECGYSAPIILEAYAPEGGYFSWKAFYRDALRRMAEPEIDKKIRVDKAIAQLKAGMRPVEINNRLSAADLRYLFEERTAQLRPIAVFIDEIQGISVCKSTFKKTDNLDVIKSLSNSKTTNYILLGTYEARDMLYYGAQLSRRVEMIHFERYRNAGDHFISAFHTLVNELSLPVAQSIKEATTYIYNHTLGCVGILISWISSALELAIKRGLQIATKQEFEDSRLKNIQLKAIAREIFSFEDEHREIESFDPENVLKEMQDIWTPQISAGGRKRNPKPGKRNPYRDPVGLGGDA